MEVMYTPGHADNSYSFLMQDRVFTGDTLMIRGTGRTDFQNGDPLTQYQSLFGRLLQPARRDAGVSRARLQGRHRQQIAEEKAHNPRLQVKSVEEYVALMNGLNLPNPKMMDVAVPANMHQGLRQEDVARRGWAYSAREALALVGETDVVLIDLREEAERERHGCIPRSLHSPYPGFRGTSARAACCMARALRWDWDWRSGCQRASATAQRRMTGRVVSHVAAMGMPAELHMLNRRLSADALLGHMRRDKKVRDGALKSCWRGGSDRHSPSATCRWSGHGAAARRGVRGVVAASRLILGHDGWYVRRHRLSEEQTLDQMARSLDQSARHRGQLDLGSPVIIQLNWRGRFRRIKPDDILFADEHEGLTEGIQ